MKVATTTIRAWASHLDVEPFPGVAGLPSERWGEEVAA